VTVKEAGGEPLTLFDGSAGAKPSALAAARAASSPEVARR
jgi:hypothetical protein